MLYLFRLYNIHSFLFLSFIGVIFIIWFNRSSGTSASACGHGSGNGESAAEGWGLDGSEEGRSRYDLSDLRGGEDRSGTIGGGSEGGRGRVHVGRDLRSAGLSAAGRDGSAYNGDGASGR